jgi:PHD/YefM family antitoxin component YafN of YafNO toxin-antitoxin module
MAVVKGRRTPRTNIKKASVVMSRARYKQLMEDLHDLAVVAERRTEPAISLEDLKKRLRHRGVL